MRGVSTVTATHTVTASYPGADLPSEEPPPTRVFLSYTKEDSEIAGLLADGLRARNIKFYRFEEQPGERWVDKIETELMKADVFFALMSPAFLESKWCRRERNLAVQREVDLESQFIRVIQVADVNPAEAGWLREYDWLDLSPPAEDKLSALWSDLGIERSTIPKQINAKHVFRNREDELGIMLNALSTTGGHDFWLVTSQPRLGKSWFLRRLRGKLNENAGGTARLVDVHEQKLDARFNPVMLVRALLDVDEQDLPNDADLSDQATLTTIAIAVANRRRRQCWLLDSAELLDERCVSTLKTALTGVYQLVKRSGIEQTRISAVVASRRTDWLGLGGIASPEARFRSMPLTAFGEDVLYQALADLGHKVGQEKLREYANRLLRLSEGLPAVLVTGLRWAKETAFLSWDHWDKHETFTRIAGSYIRDDLLSADSLRPRTGPDPAAATALLGRTFRILVTYRLFTQSHLRWHIEADTDFQQALVDIGWSLDDLWEEIRRTALLKRQTEPWLAVHPPIRRLLYRYYHPSEEEQRASHANARDVYEGWTYRDAGMEQGVVLVERLWHETVQLLMDDRHNITNSLPDIAAGLARKFKTPVYAPTEFSAYVTDRLSEDEEFQLVLRDHNGLFERMIEVVAATIAGGTS